MKLTVKERLLLVNAFGAFQGDILSIKLLDDLRTKIDFPEKEQAKYSIVSTEDGQIQWDLSVPQEREFKIGERTKKAVAQLLEKMGSQEQLSIDHASLIDKFIPQEEEEGE